MESVKAARVGVRRPRQQKRECPRKAQKKSRSSGVKGDRNANTANANANVDSVNINVNLDDSLNHHNADLDHAAQFQAPFQAQPQRAQAQAQTQPGEDCAPPAFSTAATSFSHALPGQAFYQQQQQSELILSSSTRQQQQQQHGWANVLDPNSGIAPGHPQLLPLQPQGVQGHQQIHQIQQVQQVHQVQPVQQVQQGQQAQRVQQIQPVQQVQQGQQIHQQHVFDFNSALVQGAARPVPVDFAYPLTSQDLACTSSPSQDLAVSMQNTTSFTSHELSGPQVFANQPQMIVQQTYQSFPGQSQQVANAGFIPYAGPVEQQRQQGQAYEAPEAVMDHAQMPEHAVSPITPRVPQQPLSHGNPGPQTFSNPPKKFETISRPLQHASGVAIDQIVAALDNSSDISVEVLDGPGERPFGNPSRKSGRMKFMPSKGRSKAVTRPAANSATPPATYHRIRLPTKKERFVKGREASVVVDIVEIDVGVTPAPPTDIYDVSGAESDRDPEQLEDREDDDGDEDKEGDESAKGDEDTEDADNDQDAEGEPVVPESYPEPVLAPTSPNRIGLRSNQAQTKRRTLTVKERSEATRARRLGVCVRCKFQKQKCRFDPNNPDGDCIACRNVNRESRKTVHFLQCTRIKLMSITLFRDGGLNLTDRWKGVELRNVGPRPNDIVRTIRVTQGLCSKPLVFKVIKYVPIAGDITYRSFRDYRGRKEVRKLKELTPFCFFDVYQACLDLEEYTVKYALLAFKEKTYSMIKATNRPKNIIESNYEMVIEYYYSMNNPHGGMVLDDEQDTERILLKNLFILWFGIQHTTGSLWINGDDTLDMEPEVKDKSYPLFNRVSVPRMIVAQFDSINHKLLTKYKKKVLGGLEDLLTKANHSRRWLTIYLACFVLLNEVSWICEDRYRHARDNYGQQIQFSIPTFVSNLQEGCNHLLVYWHYYNWQGWPSARSPWTRHLSHLRDTNIKQYELILETKTDYIHRKHLDIWKHLKENNENMNTLNDNDTNDKTEGKKDAPRVVYDWTSPGYWTAQLFEENWRPHPIYKAEVVPSRKDKPEDVF